MLGDGEHYAELTLEDTLVPTRRSKPREEVRATENASNDPVVRQALFNVIANSVGGLRKSISG